MPQIYHKFPLPLRGIEICKSARELRPSLWHYCDRNAEGKSVAETERALDRLAQLCQRIIEAAMSLKPSPVSTGNLIQSGGNSLPGPAAIPPGENLTEPQ